MKNRNLEQNDLMFNIQIEFGIHGVNNWKSFSKYIMDYLGKAGDTIRIVGVQTKKPTARVDVIDAISLTDLAINTYDINKAKWSNLSDEAKFWALISQMNAIMGKSIAAFDKANADEKEDKDYDEESDRANKG